MTTVTALKGLVESLVEQELDEMPIANYKTVGNFDKGSSFRDPVDRRLLTNPKAIEKIHKQWEQTPYEFDLYMVNDKRVNGYEFREQGEVNMDFVRNKMKLTPEEVPDPRPGTITVIFTNNVGDQRYMASGWILAHRVGHALSRQGGRTGGRVGNEWAIFTRELRLFFTEMLEQVYDIDLRNMGQMEGDKVLRHAAHQIGSMKSARDANLRDWYEFAYELLAQYMITGKITLKPLPKSLVTSYAAYGRKNTRNAYEPAQNMYNNHDLEYYANGLETYLENVLDLAVGKIFVM